MPSERRRRCWSGLLGAAAAVTVLGAGAAPGQAALVTLDFGTGGAADPASPYQEDGFNVAGSNLFLDPFEGNPVRSIVLDGSTPTLTVSSTAGDAFSLVSLDSLCFVFGSGGCPNDIRVQGTLAGGGTTAAVTVSSGENWATASTFAGFANLASVAISWVGPNFNRIDNIVLDTAVVPLPAALPLLATALAGLGLAWRRQEQAAT